MKIIVEGTPKEIAALVLELQERQVIEGIADFELNNSGVKLCSDNILKSE